MYINLILAVFWLVLGLALFVLRWQYPQAAPLRVEGIGVSTGWLAILLALYNLLRFASSYARRSGREQHSSLVAERERRTSASSATYTYDPTFDFSNPATGTDDVAKR
jgi:hypothetical protein